MTIRNTIVAICAAIGLSVPDCRAAELNAPEELLWSMYSDSAVGLMFRAPVGCHIEAHPDKDTDLRLEGKFPRSEKYFAITIGIPKLAPGTEPEAAIKLLDREVFPKLNGLRRVGTQRSFIGARSQFPSASETIVHELDNHPVRQRWVAFSDLQNGKQLVLMTFLMSEQDAILLDQLIAHTLPSIEHMKHARPLHPAAPTANESVFSRDGISFSYPRQWTAQASHDKDTLVKLSNPNAELALACQSDYAYLSMDAMQKIVEEEFLASLPRYKRLTENSRTYGGGKAAGLKDTFSLEIDGHPAFGQVFYFQHNGKLYVMSYFSWGLPETEAAASFDSILSSLNLR
jgi:hypothetical protein